MHELAAGDHHHVAALALAHLRQELMGEAMGAQRMRGQQPVELGRLGVRHREAAAGHAGVVDDDVHVAERVERGRGEQVHALALGHRRLDRDGLAARGRDRRDGIGGRDLVAAVVDDNLRSVRGEFLRDAATDAAAGARDDGDAASEAGGRRDDLGHTGTLTEDTKRLVG